MLHWCNLAAKESGLECTCVNSDDFTVLSQWGQQTLLSEHVYWEAIAFKMTERVRRWICFKFCVKLGHSSIAGVSNLWPMGFMQPKTKLSIYLKPFFCSSVFADVFVFSGWPKTTLLLPVCPRDAERLDTPAPWEQFGWFRRPQRWATGDWQLHHDKTPTHTSYLMQNFLVKRQITQVILPPDSPHLAPWDFCLFLKLKSPLKGKRFQIVKEIQITMTGQLMVTQRAVWGPKVPTSKGNECHCPMYNVSCTLYLLQ